MRWQFWRALTGPVMVSFPGTSAKASLSDRESAGGHWFAMLHDRHAQQVTVVFEVLAEPHDWVQVFSHPTIAMGRAKDVLALTATWDAYAPDRLSLRIAITFAVVSKKGRRDLGDQAVEVGIRLPAIIASLMATGLPVRPLDTEGFTATMLEALTGSAVGGVDELARAWAAMEQTHTEVRHGDAVSVSMTLPSRHVTADTLTAVCVPAADGYGLRTTVTYRPLDLDDDADADADADEAPDNDEEPHILGLFGAILTVTTTDPNDPHATAAAAALHRRLSLATRLGLRRAYSSQAALLAAGSGCGVLLPDAIQLPLTSIAR